MAGENVSPDTKPGTQPPSTAPGGDPPPDLLALVKSKPELHQQFTDFVNGKAREISGQYLPKIAALEAQLQQLPGLQAKLAELQEQAEGKSKTAEQRYQAQVQQLEQQRQTIAQQLEAERQRAQQLEARRADDYRRAFLMDLAAGAGAAPSALADIPMVFPAGAVKVEATPEGGFAAKLVDPQTGLEHSDPRAAMTAWLGTKPHLRAAIPGGAGQPGGTPPPKTKTPGPLDGKAPGAEQIGAAFFPGH